MVNDNYLVFGTGYDSPFWVESNDKGSVVFLEDHADWIEFQPENVKKVTTVVKYTSSMSTALEDIDNTAMLEEFYTTQVPKSVKETVWKTILVDAPEGMPDAPEDMHLPGRGQSIYAAKKLAGPQTTIFVDDCNRDVEMAYLKALLLVDGRALTVHSSGHSGPGTGGENGKTCEISPVPGS